MLTNQNHNCPPVALVQQYRSATTVQKEESDRTFKPRSAMEIFLCAGIIG